jgi:hypothetical protein
VQVPASASFPNTFTTLLGYNCSGQAIQVRRLNVGDYQVQFLGSPVTLAVGNTSRGAPVGPNDIVVGALGVVINGPGDFEIVTANPFTNANQDYPFDLLAP